jgi:hypothetical protein
MRRTTKTGTSALEPLLLSPSVRSDAKGAAHDRRGKPEEFRLLQVAPSKPCVKASPVKRHKIQLRKSESAPFSDDALR